MKSIASIETTVQVSEDSWSVVRHNLEIDDTTTVAQIYEWATKKPGSPAVRGEIRVSLLPLDSMPHIKKDDL